MGGSYDCLEARAGLQHRSDDELILACLPISANARPILHTGCEWDHLCPVDEGLPAAAGDPQLSASLLNDGLNCCKHDVDYA
eukprot:5429415-Amphidinium_carterae.1